MAAFGLARLEFDTTTESVLDRSHPAWAFYQESVDRFGGDQVVVIALAAAEPWDPGTLRRVKALSEKIEGLEGVRRVDSLSTFPIVRFSEGGELLLDPALPDGTLDQAGARLAAVRAGGDRIAPRVLVSDDGRVFAINAFLEAGSEERQSAVLDAIHGWVGEGGWVSGVPVFRTRVNAQTRHEILLFVPVTVLAIGVFLVLVFSSVRAAVISLTVSGAGTLVPLGAMGALGTPITISTMILPPVLLALGSAYVMHVLSVARGASSPGALQGAIEQVSAPIALSGLTTAIGFVALSTIRIDAIRDLGGYGALGVLSVLFATLTLAPAMLRLLPIPAGGMLLDRLLRDGLRRRLQELARSHRLVVILAWLSLLSMSAVGLSRLNVETDAVVWFPHGTPVRDSYEQIRRHLSGISPMNIVVESETGEPVTSPDVLMAMNELAEFLERFPEVGKVITLADPIIQIHKGFRSDRSLFPADGALTEQYLLLLSSAEYIDDVVSIDRLRANVLLRVNDNGSADLLKIAHRAEAWWREHGTAGFSARSTGIMFEFARAEDEIAWGQVRGLAFALAAISVVLFAIFRWPLLAAIAVIPNVIPLSVVFGGMGLAGVPLDAVTVGLGSMALGIAVDDTIHLVSGYQEGVRGGLEPIAALGATLDRVLPPLVYSTVAITGGFAVLWLSGFTVTQNLGFVTAATVLLCLLADLTLLPALLVNVGAKRPGVIQ